MNDQKTGADMAEADEPKSMAVPQWFRRALADTPSSHLVTVLDCDIHYLRWGPAVSVLSGILFIHAGGAHAQWWSFIAPFFAENRPVAAIDLSGMGDSGRRERYGSEFHVPEIAAVLSDARLGERPVVVGHSFGGFMTMCFGYQHGAEISGTVIVESRLRPEEVEKANPTQAYTRPKSVYPDLESILKRFRLGPAQSCENDFILDFIAQASVTKCQGSWTWKFDVAARGAAHFDEPLARYLKNMACCKALIYGAESMMVTGEVAEYMATLFGPDDPIIRIPAAHHHLFLDQPLAFVAALRGILTGWGF